MWRKPTLEDRDTKRLLARSMYEVDTFYVQWNDEWNNWCLANNNHVLVSIYQVWSNKEE